MRAAPLRTTAQGTPTALRRENDFPGDARRRALLAAVIASGALCLAIWLGSAGLKHFDDALVHYAAASVIALFALVQRLSLWFSRPPTRRLFLRAWENVNLSEALRRRRAPGGVRAIAGAPEVYGAQTFIRKRGLLRWGAHMCLSWGSMLAFAITFPLVFGWVHFEVKPGGEGLYTPVVFGFIRAPGFPVHSLRAFLAFNMLNIAGVLVLVGVILAATRRLISVADRAAQTFTEDWLPLIILGAVSATGLGLTVSSKVFHGAGYSLMAWAHAGSVVVLLLHIPFGKLLHIFQRTAHLAVAINKRAALSAPAAHCVRCGAPFASAAQIADLKRVQEALGMRFEWSLPDGGDLHYQDVCPSCRRALLALNQGTHLAEVKYRR